MVLPGALKRRLLDQIYRTPLKPDSLIDVAEHVLATAPTSTCVSNRSPPHAKGPPPARAIMLVGPMARGVRPSTIAKLATELTCINNPCISLAPILSVWRRRSAANVGRSAQMQILDGRIAC